MVLLLNCLFIFLSPLEELTLRYVSAEEDNADFSLRIGSRCTKPEECQEIVNGYCDTTSSQCKCMDDYPILDVSRTKCGSESKLNDTCFFKEQCASVQKNSVCDLEKKICVCDNIHKAHRFPDDHISCVLVEPKSSKTEIHIDPAMIGILIALFLMFIIICVVLRMFSRARFREQRTIFNTPNPRLMNISVFNGSGKKKRRGSSAGSRRGSRQPSIASLQDGNKSPTGSARGNQGSKPGTPRTQRSPRSSIPVDNPKHTNGQTPRVNEVAVELEKHQT